MFYQVLNNQTEGFSECFRHKSEILNATELGTDIFKTTKGDSKCSLFCIEIQWKAFDQSMPDDGMFSDIAISELVV